VAVGAVVLNRIEHPSFPNSLSGVIYQSGAFTCMVDGSSTSHIRFRIQSRPGRTERLGPHRRRDLLFQPIHSHSSWIWSRPLLVTIGKHRFCGKD
jgi:N-acetylmuramoyl-L-alanine amidase